MTILLSHYYFIIISLSSQTLLLLSNQTLLFHYRVKNVPRAASNNRKPFVSIIIVNYNGEPFLNECLSSVFRTEYPNFEVVLVDNASTDKSLELVNKGFAGNRRLNVIRNCTNLGFGPANNVGFKHTKGDYIVFLNNDTSVDPKWLATLVSTMEKDQTIGLAQSLILNMDGQSIQGGGCLISDFWILQWPIGRTNESYSDKFPNVFEISFAMGTAMIIKREFLQEIGLFDPKYFWYYDDDYLSFRTWLAGKRVVTVSNSKVRHVGGGTRRKETYNIEQFYLTIDFISLNLSFYRELRYLIISLFINVVNMIRESLREIITERKALRFWGNMTAARWILRNFRYMWKNRLKYWSKAVINEKTLMHRMIRINIPTSVYLVPRLLFPLYKSETNKYQKKLMEQHQRELQHSGAREEIWQGTGSSVS